MKTYWITVKKMGTEYNAFYSQVSTNWQYAGATPTEEENNQETWSCETETPEALEALLNVDDSVISYTGEQPNGY